MTRTTSISLHCIRYAIVLLVAAVPQLLAAATMSLSPGTGVHSVGDTFTMRVQLSTGGNAVNAADGTLRYDTDVLSVVQANRSNSIFNLWVTEPAVDRAAGTVSWSGGLPAGFDGASGEILRVTFRTKQAGTGRVSFSDGAVLANDGRGSNVLTNMTGASYTVQPVSTASEPRSH